MVVALGPGKFYGSSLPRPRYYSNPNGDRTDPPVPVLDPLLSWAEEAHWSMGGLSFKRLRLQGRIEGNINKLKAERAKFERKANKKSPLKKVLVSPVESVSPSPPPAPLNLKRKRRLIDESDEENEDVVEKRGPVRKLNDDFERVADKESGGVVKRRTRSVGNREEVVEVVDKVKGKRLKKGVKSSEKGVKIGEKGGLVTPNGTRTSPRLGKHRSS